MIEELRLFQKRNLEDKNVYWKMEFWFNAFINEKIKGLNVIFDICREIIKVRDSINLSKESE